MSQEAHADTRLFEQQSPQPWRKPYHHQRRQKRDDVGRNNCREKIRHTDDAKHEQYGRQSMVHDGRVEQIDAATAGEAALQQLHSRGEQAGAKEKHDQRCRTPEMPARQIPRRLPH